MTFAQRYKALAEKLAPLHATDLCEEIPDDADASDIDDIVYRRGEYVGGMATVLIELARTHR
jgi:hypothetical protein